MSNQDSIDRLAGLIAGSQHLVVFTGAGISTESGLPDYRGPDGVWTRRDKGLPPPRGRPLGSARPNAGHMAPVASAQIATEPLSGPSPIPAGCCVCSTDARPEYFRTSADGRLIFGAGERFGSRAIGDPVRLARPRLLRVFPQLARARIEHAWSGHVAVTRDRLPRFGRVAPNGFYAHGFCGHGVVLSQIAGRLLAEAVAGINGRFDLLASLPIRSFAALGPLTRPVAALALLAQTLRAGL